MNRRAQGRLPVAASMLLLPVIAAVLTGCASAEPDYAAVCVDPVTKVRVDDDQCGDPDDDGDTFDHGGFYYVWVGTRSTQYIPAYGKPVPESIGSRHYPTGSVITRKLPAAGVPKVADARKYPPYVPATPFRNTGAPQVPAAPPAQKNAPQPANPNVQRGGLGVPDSKTGGSVDSKSGSKSGSTSAGG